MIICLSNPMYSKSSKGQVVWLVKNAAELVLAPSGLEPSRIGTHLRSSLRRAEFIRGRVNAIHLENRKVVLASDSPTGQLVIPYDQPVLALGSVSNYLGMANIEKLAFNFKTLLDAIRIRNYGAHKNGNLRSINVVYQQSRWCCRRKPRPGSGASL